MKTLKIGLCFLDEEDNIIVKKVLEANWSMDWKEMLKKENKIHMIDEVSHVLAEMSKVQITEELIKSMLESYEKKLESGHLL
jgi:hypothetical protein